MRGSMELRLDTAPRRLHLSPHRSRIGSAACALALLLGTLAFGTTSCSSGGSKAATTEHAPVELRYRALAKDLSFGLVNESHSDRTDLYSTRQPLDHATTKVSPDEVVDAVVEYFRDQGFFDIAVAGASPATPPPGASQILEVTLPDGQYYAMLRAGVSADYVTRFQTCAKALLDVYNNTLQLQAVDEAPNWNGNSARSTSKSRGKNSAGSGG